MSNTGIGYRILSGSQTQVNYDLCKENLTLKYLLIQLMETRVLPHPTTLKGL